jgi:hypothetical protein
MINFTLGTSMVQQAVIERSVASEDAAGAERSPVWRAHVTVPCAFWWDKATGTRSANRRFVNVSRDVAVSAGGMIIPSGTDVTVQDRVAAVLHADDSVLINGVFTILAVLNEFTHMEIDVERTGLGA